MMIGTLDFETEAITPRPSYPPKPVGVALKPWGKRATYWRWGHPSENNCSQAQGFRHIKTFVRNHTLLCHSAGFDLDVLETHCGVRWPAEHHDTLLLAFLEDPDSDSLALKPLAQRYLDEPPTEQDAVRDFVLDRVRAKDPQFRFPDGKWPNAKTFGAFIARCPGGLIEAYAKGDTTRTEALFRLLYARVRAEKRLLSAYQRELKVTRTLIKMERRGLPVDVLGLERDVSRYIDAKWKIEEQLLTKLRFTKSQRTQIIQDYDGQELFKWGGQGFANRLLSSKLVKSLPQTEKGNDSTSAENLALVMPEKLAHEFEVRSQISTCLNTFMRPWWSQGKENDGIFHARFNQVRAGDEWGKKVGARTGRLSMTPNLQNVIRSDKDERVPKLRNYVVPGKRFAALGVRDYSQQELRLLAEYEDGPFKASYLADPTQDAHLLVKELIHQTTGLALDRRPVKDLNFGLIYGQGLALTAKKMGVSREDAQRARKAHAASLPGIPKLQQLLKDHCAVNEPIWTWGGRRYYCEKPALIHGRWWTFEYKMLNKLIQGSAADCTKQAMVNYDALGQVAEDNPLLLQVHDDLMIGITRWRDAKRAHEALRDAMADLADLTIPMLSDGKISKKSWGQAEKVKW